MIRRISFAVLLALGLSPAFAQPPPVPALPDTERRTSYSLSSSVCTCSVGFALYGDSTDYGNWLDVKLITGSGATAAITTLTAVTDYTITSATGSLATIARPITDAVLTLTVARTGTLQIVGAQRPRRLSQFAENRGVAARDLNQALTGIVASNRETWDRTNDISGRALLTNPGESIGPLPNQSARASNILGFDGGGNPTLYAPQTPAASASANTVYAGPASGPSALPTFRALVGADIPAPGPSALGGVFSKTAVSSNWLRSLGSDGNFTASQPAFTDISGGGTGVVAALGINVGSPGAFIVNGGTGSLASLAVNSCTIASLTACFKTPLGAAQFSTTAPAVQFVNPANTAAALVLGSSGDTTQPGAVNGYILTGDSSLNLWKGLYQNSILNTVVSEDGLRAQSDLEFGWYQTNFWLTTPNSGYPGPITGISNGSPAVVTANGHALANNTTLYFTTTGTLPSPLTPNTVYYAINVTTNTFNVSLTPSGSAINTTTGGSGTHTLIPAAQLNRWLNVRWDQSTGPANFIQATFNAKSCFSWKTGNCSSFSDDIVIGTSNHNGEASFTANGAASAPAVVANGTWFSGGSATTTKPYVNIEPSGTTSTGWNTAGTGLGINAASGFAGNLIDLQLAGVSKFSVNSAGQLASLSVNGQSSFNGALVTGAAAAFTHGAAANGTPVAQTVGFENAAGTNIAAAAQATVNGPLSTGTGAAGTYNIATGFKGVTGGATATFTNASPTVVTVTAHGYLPGQVLQFSNSGGALPTGITAATNYYVLSTGLTVNTFQISLTAGGAAVNTSSTGSGTQTSTPQTNVLNAASNVAIIGPSGVISTQTTPALSLTQVWNTDQTQINSAIKLNITNLSSNFQSTLLDLQVGGTSQFKVREDGVVTALNNFNSTSGGYIAANTAEFRWSSRSRIGSNADGQIYLVANSGAAMLLQFGGLANTNPALKASGTALQVRLADDSGYGSFDGGSYSASGTAGVSCGTGVPNIATLVVTNGIVTHC